MAVTTIKTLETWDPFFQRVQHDLVEPLVLRNVEITVDRHEGENGNVGVAISPYIENVPKGSSKTLHHDHSMSHSQLTVDELTKAIMVKLVELLETCDVRFGDITFVVNNKGLLEEIQFSYSKRPHESTKQHFTAQSTGD